MRLIGFVVAIGFGRSLMKQAIALPVCTNHAAFEIIVAS